MPRIPALDPATAPGDAKTLMDGVRSSIGMVPNIFATFAQSPKVLEGFLAFNGALGDGLLPGVLREQIALAMAGANRCDYCASAHSLMAKGAGVAEDERARNLRGESVDAKTAAALAFVRSVVHQRGKVGDAEVASLRTVGFSDGEIVEIVAHIGVNMFTNYFNHIVDTEIDFPAVRTTGTAAAA